MMTPFQFPTKELKKMLKILSPGNWRSQNFKNFRAFAPGPHLGGLQQPPNPPAVYNSLRALRALRSYARFARLSTGAPSRKGRQNFYRPPQFISYHYATVCSPTTTVTFLVVPIKWESGVIVPCRTISTLRRRGYKNVNLHGILGHKKHVGHGIKPICSIGSFKRCCPRKCALSL